jgi:hypothetical protein
MKSWPWETGIPDGGTRPQGRMAAESISPAAFGNPQFSAVCSFGSTFAQKRVGS